MISYLSIIERRAGAGQRWISSLLCPVCLSGGLLALVLLVCGCTAAPRQALSGATAAALRQGSGTFENPQANFPLRVWWRNRTPLSIGSELTLRVQAGIDVYINLFLINPYGRTFLLAADYPLAVGETLVAGHGATIRHQLMPPEGRWPVVVLASRQPLDWPSVVERQGASPADLGLSARELLSGLDAALQSLPAEDWNGQVVERLVRWPVTPSPRVP